MRDLVWENKMGVPERKHTSRLSCDLCRDVPHSPMCTDLQHTHTNHTHTKKNLKILSMHKGKCLRDVHMSVTFSVQGIYEGLDTYKIWIYARTTSPLCINCYHPLNCFTGSYFPFTHFNYKENNSGSSLQAPTQWDPELGFGLRQAGSRAVLLTLNVLLPMTENN